jgi:transposase
MPRPLSNDLRERVARTVEDGSSRRQAAGRFGVSVSFVVKLLQRWQAERGAGQVRWRQGRGMVGACRARARLGCAEPG